MLKRKPLAAPATNGRLVAYQGRGFWQSDRELLEGPWNSGSAPWKVSDWKVER
jgi:hypothetical protein